jgi:sugar O-acyltransferase (sialic acid O-acetyltransferase NeuD family)
MPTEVVVVGAGGFGRETLDVIEAHNAGASPDQVIVIGVVDDNPSEINLDRLQARGYRHLGGVSHVLETVPAAGYVLGVGNSAGRRNLSAAFDLKGWAAVTVVHPAAVLGSRSRIADGAVICGGVQLSTNTLVGNHVHLNPNATVGHDTVLEDFVSVNPAATISGQVTVGAGALVGAGAVILQGLSVGADSVVGAGACVTRSVAPNTTVVGVPARVLLRGDGQWDDGIDRQ